MFTLGKTQKTKKTMTKATNGQVKTEETRRANAQSIGDTHKRGRRLKTFFFFFFFKVDISETCVKVADASTNV